MEYLRSAGLTSAVLSTNRGNRLRTGITSVFSFETFYFLDRFRENSTIPTQKVAPLAIRLHLPPSFGGFKAGCGKATACILVHKNALAIKCPFLLLRPNPGGFIKNFPAKRQGIERQRTVYVAAIQIIQIGLIRVGFTLGIII